MKMKLLALLFIALLPALSFAQIGNIDSGILSLCGGLKDLLPVVAMLMVIFGAVVYAAGQMMGAETRARANVWSTSAVVGALMAIMIVVIGEPILEQLYGSKFQCRAVCPTAKLASGNVGFCCYGDAAAADDFCQWNPSSPAAAQKCCNAGKSTAKCVAVGAAC